MGGPSTGYKGGLTAVPKPTARSRPTFGQQVPSRAQDTLPAVARPSVRPSSASSYREQSNQDEDWNRNWYRYNEGDDYEHDEEDNHQDQDANGLECDEARLGYEGFSDCSWQPESEDNPGRYYVDDKAEDLTQGIDDNFAPGSFIGILKMLNCKKGFGFISPVLSDLPSEFSAGANGLWFFGDHHLPEHKDNLGSHVQFSVKLAGTGKLQAFDVMLADQGAAGDVGSQDFQRTVHDAIINGMKDLDSNRCHNGHMLQKFVTEMEGYGCNVCEKEFPSNTTMFACRACDVDKCEKCYSANAPRSAQAKGRVIKPIVKPVVRSKLTENDKANNFNKVLVVSTLPLAWTIMDVEKHFVRFGPVDSVFMLPNYDRTCGVVFATTVAAVTASERTKALIHGSGQGTMGCLTIQHFSSLLPDMRHEIEGSLDEFAPWLKEGPKQPPPPSFAASKRRLIGTVSSTVVSGMRVITSSKLLSGTAVFDPAQAPQDALEGATVAFGVENDDRYVDDHVLAVVLEVLSRPSPENASLLADAAAAAAPRSATAPSSTKKSRTDQKGKEVSLKCFPCKEAVEFGRCANEATCPYAHTLAEVQPLPETEVVKRVAKKRYGKASLQPMAAPSMLPTAGPNPMGFGMMPPVMGMNPFLPSMGMPSMPFGMNPFMMPAMATKMFSSKKSKKRKR